MHKEIEMESYLAHLVIGVHFSTSKEGGRRGPITLKKTPPYYRCILRTNNQENFDCQVCLEEAVIAPGGTYDLPVRLLSPEIALPFLAVGNDISVCEGWKVVATGVIKEIRQF
jgi:hypothetical protein